MILQGIRLENFTAFHELDWQGLGNLNVVVGMNDTGKSHLLKLIYSLVHFSSNLKELEVDFEKRIHVTQYNMSENKTFNSFVADGFIFEILTSFAGFDSEYHAPPSVMLINRNENFSKIDFNLNGYSASLNIYKKLSPTTDMPHNTLECEFLYDLIGSALGNISVFIPPKEILTILDAIFETRDGNKKIDTFDDTYYNLAKLYRLREATNFSSPNFEKLMPFFRKIMNGGKVEFSGTDSTFIRDDEHYSMHQTAEGIKKVAILERLIRNHSILPDGQTVLCIDEPETNLHPQAIIAFADLLHALAHEAKVQIFVATHSYYLMKRLEQLARRDQVDSTLLDLRRDDNQRITADSYQLKDGLKPNPIYDQSRWLLEQDVEINLRLKDEDDR